MARALCIFVLLLLPVQRWKVGASAATPLSKAKAKRDPVALPRLGGANASVVIVAVPHEDSFLPLLALARQLGANGHRVTMAVPKSHEAWAESMRERGDGDDAHFPDMLVTASPSFPSDEASTADDVESDISLLRRSFISQRDRQDPEMRSSWYTILTRFNVRESINILSRKHMYDTLGPLMRYYNRFHAPMLETLLATYGPGGTIYSGNEDAERPSPSNHPLAKSRPDLFVVDRYAFAGFSAAAALSVPYVVNSVGPLNDLDNPDNHVPAPLADHSMRGPQSIIGRCLNLIFRLRYRLTTGRAFLDINRVRAEFGISPITSRQQLYGRAFVLANTVFGIDDPRPLKPLVRVVGPLLASDVHSEGDALSPSYATGSAGGSAATAIRRRRRSIIHTKMLAKQKIIDKKKSKQNNIWLEKN